PHVETMSLNKPGPHNLPLIERIGIVRWVPATLWAGAIFAVSSVPGSNLPPGPYAAPGHFVAYAILGTLIYIALRPRHLRPAAVSLAIILASLYGATDELHQAFVPGRTPDITDWGIDTLGAAAGVLVAVLGERQFSRVVRRDDKTSG
ncbi:MAG: VanZ family protein, partial [Actinomycetota bacterium]|nr:VanZ family protein [Actinomycetota bacterium]